MGGTQRLAERAGTGRAREFVMSGRPLRGRELERWNVVNRVLPDEGFDAAARAYAASWPRVRPSPMPPPSGSCADYLEGGVELANDRVGGSPVSCSPPRTSRARCAPSCATARDGPAFHGR